MLIHEKLEKLIRELEKDYERWEYLKEFGGSDPFWEDGANMNLVRNHIIYDRQKIKDLCSEKGLKLPQIYYKEVPQKTDNKYMANAEKIRKGAAKSLRIYENDVNFNELEKVYPDISNKRKKQIAGNILNYKKGLRSYIESDDLVGMRRHLYYERYLESVKGFMDELQETDVSRQMSLWSMV